MASDIVNRLRRYRPNDEWGLPGQHTICDEAADEITALRKRCAELEAARAEQWRLRRNAEGSRDAASAAADSLRIERDMLRAALEPFAKLYSEIPEDNFWPTEEYKNLSNAAKAYTRAALSIASEAKS